MDGLSSGPEGWVYHHRAEDEEEGDQAPGIHDSCSANGGGGGWEYRIPYSGVPHIEREMY